MEIIKRLRHLEEVGKRLQAMSDARGIPAPQKAQLTAEAEAIHWAFRDLRQRHFHALVCIAGQEDFVYEFLDTNQIYAADKDIASAILIDPEEPLVDQIHRTLVSNPKWPGDRLAEGKTPKWLHCERYFACGVEEHPNKRAVLLYCLVDKDWLADIGTNKAKILVREWMEQVYHALDWTKAKTTE